MGSATGSGADHVPAHRTTSGALTARWSRVSGAVDQVDDPLGGRRRVANSTVTVPLAVPGSTRTRVSSRSESRSARSRDRGRPAARPRGAGARPAVALPTATSSSTERTDRPSATIRGGQPVLAGGVVQRRAAPGRGPRERPPRRPGAAPAAGSRSSRRVLRDLRARAADPAGQLLVGAAEVVEQLLVGGRLLQRVELRAVQVLQQRVAQQVVVGRVADDRGDRARARPAARPASAARP